MKVRYTALAKVDVVDALSYMEAVSPEVARRFGARIKGVEQLISQFPQIGSTTRLPWLRRVKVHGYPYLVFYEVAESLVVIHAVRHGARRPFDEANG